MEHAFHQTRGIDIDTISQQFPVEIQLEVLFHLNLTMMRKVPIFHGARGALLRSLVMKFVVCICTANETILSAGDKVKAMYFVKRGILESSSISYAEAFRDHVAGDCFGELALLPDHLRKSLHTIQAVTDCTLLSIPASGFDSVDTGNISPMPCMRVTRRHEWAMK